MCFVSLELHPSDESLKTAKPHTHFAKIFIYSFRIKCMIARNCQKVSTCRYHFTGVNSINSDMQFIECGVYQGSILDLYLLHFY